MYLGIDVGGTKTLVAAISDDGVIKEEKRFSTPENYAEFKTRVAEAINGFEAKEFRAGGIGSAGRIDRQNGRLIKWTNIPWEDIPMRADIEKLSHCPMVLENDAKMGGLSEAMAVKNSYSRVLYIAIGTGIGMALIVNGQIDSNITDGGGRALVLEHEGNLTPWEEFAGGRAFVRRFGQKAAEITDEKTWQAYSRDLAQGLLQLIAITEPETIIIGGSVGRYFDRFGSLLKAELNKQPLPLIAMPKTVLAAQRPEEAVIYGCYELARQVFDHA